MSPDRYELVTRNAEEVVTEDELRTLLEETEHPTAYIGFEPSGTAHLGWKVCANKIRDLQDAGIEVTVLLADWHAQINDKLDGDLGRIRACGLYMEHVFKALGVDEGTTFLYASEWVDDPDYWATVLRVAKASTLNRIKRAMSIMGREADEADLDYGKTIYPAMQVADIFYGAFDIAYGGMDQRHAHMLARDVAKKLDLEPPVALHTPLISSLGRERGRMDPVEVAKIVETVETDAKFRPGTDKAAIRRFLERREQDPEEIEKMLSAYDPSLSTPFQEQITELGIPLTWSSEGKMSKSDPSSGIFLHDDRDEVQEKLKGAYCPAGEVEGNPVLSLLKHVVMPEVDALNIDRPEKFGGPLTFQTYDEVEAAFLDGLHPLDLKKGTAAALNEILGGVRAYFEEHPEGLKALEQAIGDSAL